ncbi:MAG: hypothetical protein ACE5HH_03735 [Candidatus Hydrothermarchaeales archaeon]
MDESVFKAGALVLTLVIGAIIFWFIKKQRAERPVLKEPRPLQGFTFKKPDMEKKPAVAEFQRLLGRSALIEYTPTEDYEKATMMTVVNYLSSGKNVILISQAPRTKMYHEKLEYFIQKDVIKLVDITIESPLAKPQMFRVTTRGDETVAAEEIGIIPVSINNLEYLTEITEEMPDGSILIFEALTGIILSLGEDRKEAVYKFFSGIVEEMSTRDRTLVVFLNRSAHEKEVVSAYEGLFMNILKLEGDFLVALKGEKKRIAIEVFEE